MGLTFLGVAGTLTASKYSLEAEHERLIVGCGPYPRMEQLRLGN